MIEIIAEIGLQHDGSLREALAFVRACAKRGVDVVKFQSHLCDTNSEFRPGTEHHFPQDRTRRDYWRRTAFGSLEWARIRQECDDCGVEFMCTPFSLSDAHLLQPLTERWKIGSGNVTDKPLVDFCQSTKPVIYSNGFGYDVQIEGLELACISKYPTPLDEAMARLDEVKHSPRWGWSSHTGKITDSLIAARIGAQAIEVHVCWSKEQGGPDVESAVTMEELQLIVECARGDITEAM